MQLVAYGAQDIYLTGSPQITYFKVVYRRHTNFSIEMDELTIDSARMGNGFGVDILRNGDLCNGMFLKLRTPAITSSVVPFNSDPVLNTKVAWVRRLGHAAIKSIKIKIGGTDVDKHVGTWLDLWYELTHTSMQERGYNKMIGDVPELTTLTGASVENQSDPIIPAYTMYIPLQFWFNRNPGLALPLIALQYHPVRLEVELEEVSKLLVWSGASAPTFTALASFERASLMVDYIFLDSEERRRFAQVGHEYLIEQVQFPGEETISGTMSSSITSKTKLTFNHPCKEIVWALKCGAFNGEGNKYGGTSTRGRFLAYTDNDNAWDQARDYAAANLAYGCFVPNGSDAPSGAITSDLTTAASLAAGATAVYTNTVTLASGNNIYVSMAVTNATNSTLSSGTVVASFIKNPLKKDNINLLDSLARISPATPNALVTVAITVESSSSAISQNIAVTGHGLTLRDISIPIPDWDADYRFKGSASLNPWDVSVIQPSNYGLRLDGAGNPVAGGNIQLNGHPRFDVVEGPYFNYVQPGQVHTRTPADGINVYSFGLHPEQHQPSGTANLSRIDTTILNLTFSDPFRSGKAVPILNFLTDSKFYIFAFNYNVLRIMSGMAGLAYSN